MPKVNFIICLKSGVVEEKAKSFLKTNIPSIEFISQSLELENILIHCSIEKSEAEKIFSVKLVPIKRKSSNLNVDISHTAWGHRRPFIIPESFKEYVAYALVDHVLLTID